MYQPGTENRTETCGLELTPGELPNRRLC